jgi:hypothetical protein
MPEDQLSNRRMVDGKLRGQLTRNQPECLEAPLDNINRTDAT